jgi:hypothetical protein
LGGAIKAIMPWLHYGDHRLAPLGDHEMAPLGDHGVAPLRRSPFGSMVAITNILHSLHILTSPFLSPTWR